MAVWYFESEPVQYGTVPPDKLNRLFFLIHFEITVTLFYNILKNFHVWLSNNKLTSITIKKTLLNQHIFLLLAEALKLSQV